MVALFYAANMAGIIAGFSVAEKYGLFQGVLTASIILFVFPTTLQYLRLEKENDTG